jgi:hypothetical protein
MDSDSFGPVATLLRFIFAVFLFIWVFRFLIWTKRKNRKGKLVPYKFRIPSGYKDLCIRGDDVDGSFALGTDKSTLTLRSKNSPQNYGIRKNELLTPHRSDYTISYLEEGRKVNPYGLSFRWLKTKHVTKSFEMMMISYLLDDQRVQIEVGCGSRTDDFSVFRSDYETFIDSIQLKLP